MIYTCRPKKISLYINTGKKTMAQIQAETGCTALINGGWYTLATFTPVMHLKADGKVLSSRPETYDGFAWNTADLVLTRDYSEYENYICCICLVKDGKAVPLEYDPSLGGNRPRTAIGIFPDGRAWLYAVQSPAQTPEALQKLALGQGLQHVIMLDGGGSTQGASPTETTTSTRIVQNYICVWAETEEEEHTMFKLALGAGHGINTPGKRCLKALDPNETREWWLNDRVCDYIEDYLKAYEGYSLLRLDDSDDGEENVELATRVKQANDWKADFYLSVHHNAGINGGSGGGIVCYSYGSTGEGSKWRDAFYDALIKHTGLKGNRSQPKTTGNLYVLRKTTMPAVLLELGFMDSKTDVPVILTDEYAQQCAKAIVEVIVARGKLTKKKVTAPVQKDDTLYRVQLGAFGKRENAERLAAELKAKGYQVYITKV